MQRFLNETWIVLKACVSGFIDDNALSHGRYLPLALP